jgi:hypothetical protein
MKQTRRTNASATKFQKGHARIPNSGRPKGGRNRNTILLKDAIIKAAELVGEDGKGKGQLVGYLMSLARKEKPVFARLLERVLPLHLHLQEAGQKSFTPAEAAQRLKERGLPVPESLLELAKSSQVALVANELNDAREDGESDDLDNRRLHREPAEEETHFLRGDGSTILEGDEDWPGYEN